MKVFVGSDSLVRDFEINRTALTCSLLHSIETLNMQFNAIIKYLPYILRNFY
jgi:hypothetical protein